ncbi:threonine dehydrogenase-like Zn-dependent dehydrogenase [Friedmanniella endophytica]|uniref:Threonine dehydrogenase-like Zn-dependent dehydrogenase n=1 Tax=Microlunatus kandeliicorticis TaxID=1759536 RepID=A0A7W3P5R7_9ACTN|nr:L-idonate 5-dehydrogenase [Microlunatus kandeliicorticis]MBA8794203.1 threonine dehydrogenase-like Zn-dependent dehydrogenase [Microlunatus kandeliicorticis]
MDVPDRVRAVRVPRAGELEVTSVELPAPRPDEAVVRIGYGGVCGSDLHYWTHGNSGTSILREPLVLGHEVVGTVARTAADGSGPAEGTEVAVHPATPVDDGVTRYPADRPNLAPLGTYLGSAAHLPHTAGAFADYAVLPSRMLRPLPAGLSLRLAALTEPASVAWHGVARAGDVRGRSVLVVGAGPIGALTVGVLVRAGAEVTAVDLHERPLALATALGAHRVVDARDADAVRAVQPDVAIETSGSAPGLASAVESVTRGGIVVLVGMLPPGPQPVPVAVATVRELELRGSFRFNDEIDEVITALADGSLAVEPVISHEFDADDAVEAFRTAGDPAASSKVLLRF